MKSLLILLGVHTLFFLACCLVVGIILVGFCLVLNRYIGPMSQTTMGLIVDIGYWGSVVPIAICIFCNAAHQVAPPTPPSIQRQLVAPDISPFHAAPDPQPPAPVELRNGHFYPVSE